MTRPLKRRRISYGKSAYMKLAKRSVRRLAVAKYIPRAPTNKAYFKGPLPRKMRCRHIYQTYVVLNAGGAGIVGNWYSANGMYDPDISGVGHQPLGFDQMCVFYDHYIVTGAKISVRTVGTSAQNVVMVLYANDTTSPALTLNAALEQRNTKSCRLISDQVSKLSMKLNPCKYLGSKRKKWDDELKGNAGANPSEQVYFLVGVDTVDGSDAAADNVVEVKIQYVATWVEPKTLAQS